MRVPRFVTLAAVPGIAVAVLAPAAASATTVSVTAATARPHELSGVSCVSSAKCMAVGSIDNGKAGNGASPLAETWQGTSWKTVTVKLPPGAFDTGLTSVSCTPPARCVAVGTYVTLTAAGALVGTWNGKAWTPSTPPAPAGALMSGLEAVSCVSAVRCVAVGEYLPMTGFALLAESWNGVKWVPSTPPGVKGSVAPRLTSVSCVSAARCVAAGYYDIGSTMFPLIESWNGKSWTRMNAPAPAGSGEAFLTGVSCASAKSCVAVGTVAASSLTAFSEVWNGKTWRVARIGWPRGTGSSFLTGVSCVPAARCLAVGYTGSNPGTGENTGRAAAVSWNGKAWTATRVPAPANGKASLFNAVSCLSATDCVAAGQEGPFNTVQGNGLTGFWNGKGWKLVAAA